MIGATGDTVAVRINGQSASKRTRSRVKENGPLFEIVKMGAERQKMRTSAVLLQSKTTNWLGWLPTKEIVVSIPKEKK